MMELQHLKTSVRDIATEEQDSRIKFILQDKWIPYPKAESILNRLDEIIDSPTTIRMINYLIVGETNNGKTALVNKLQQKYMPKIYEGIDGMWLPVLAIQAPPVPDERRLYNNILDRLSIPYSASSNISIKEKHIVKVLKKMHLKMLVIDEIHHVLAGTLKKQREFLNVIKYISNELNISIVAAGTKDAFNAINIDPQLSNRFETGILTKWKYNKEFLRLLASFESVLPLKEPSNLHNRDLSMKIFTMSEGTIGEVSNLLKKAAVYSVKNNKENITLQTFNKINWKNPSDRRKIRL